MLFLVAGCKGNAQVRGESVDDPVRPSVFVVLQPLPFEPEQARIVLQYGRVIARAEWNQYDDACFVELRQVPREAGRVATGTFSVVDIRHTLDAVVYRAPMVRLAALQRVNEVDGGGSKAYHEGYHFVLESAAQPGVFRLSCYGDYAEPPDLEPPTLADIRRVLGELASLR